MTLMPEAPTSFSAFNAVRTGWLSHRGAAADAVGAAVIREAVTAKATALVPYRMTSDVSFGEAGTDACGIGPVQPRVPLVRRNVRSDSVAAGPAGRT
ncbi:hypothetical protein AB0B79_14060 [Streptomyces sp. NPDC039022]|uniref:hypothetical protein n=1 Tax=unclassified Streptomyces TaxID=2593676 RepID=UPI0033C5FDBA